jgi:hypothetical protein
MKVLMRTNQSEFASLWKKIKYLDLFWTIFIFIRVFGFICICRVLEKNKYGTEMCDIGAFNGMD